MTWRADPLEQRYMQARDQVTDIHQHVPTLRWLAMQAEVVVEFGVRTAVSTTALLAGQPRQLWSYDIRESPQARELAALAGRTEFRFEVGDSRHVQIPVCDLLFIDTRHDADQLAAELAAHHRQVRRWIALHDTTTFGMRGETPGRDGLWPSLRNFLSDQPSWRVWKDYRHNNGFTVLRRGAR